MLSFNVAQRVPIATSGIMNASFGIVRGFFLLRWLFWFFNDRERASMLLPAVRYGKKLASSLLLCSAFRYHIPIPAYCITSASAVLSSSIFEMPAVINSSISSFVPLWGLITVPIFILGVVLWVAIKSPGWFHWFNKRRRERTASQSSKSRSSTSTNSETPSSAQSQA